MTCPSTVTSDSPAPSPMSPVSSGRPIDTTLPNVTSRTITAMARPIASLGSSTCASACWPTIPPTATVSCERAASGRGDDVVGGGAGQVLRLAVERDRRVGDPPVPADRGRRERVRDVRRRRRSRAAPSARPPPPPGWRRGRPGPRPAANTTGLDALVAAGKWRPGGPGPAGSRCRAARSCRSSACPARRPRRRARPPPAGSRSARSSDGARTGVRASRGRRSLRSRNHERRRSANKPDECTRSPTRAAGASER